MNTHHDCLWFNGFKPCKPYKLCHACPDYSPIDHSFLYIHTGGLGDIIRLMSVLQELIKSRMSQYPHLKVFIATCERGKGLFQGLSERYPFHIKILLIDDIILAQHVLQFSEVFNLDRDLKSAALATTIRASCKWGFKLNSNGTIGIFNESANYLYRLGLDDKLKFQENIFSVDQIFARAFDLVASEEAYDKEMLYYFPQSMEQGFAPLKAKLKGDFAYLVGVNLGVSDVLPNKSLSSRVKIRLLLELMHLSRLSQKSLKILLLGGEKEMQEGKELLTLVRANADQGHQSFDAEWIYADDINESSLFIKTLDFLITSDTFALHMALAVKCPVLTWFGPTHPQEIKHTQELHLVRSSKTCSPCWKKKCHCPEEICNDDTFLEQEMLQKLHLLWKKCSQ